MNIQFNVTITELERFGHGLSGLVQALRGAAHQAMAERFYEIVANNFGESGEDRPSAWAPLTPRYAKRVGREYATLAVTGRLFDAVKVESDMNSGRVSVSNSDCPYALVHQYGGGNNIPARPYFPIEADGEPTSYAQSVCWEAGAEVIADLLG